MQIPKSMTYLAKDFVLQGEGETAMLFTHWPHDPAMNLMLDSDLVQVRHQKIIRHATGEREVDSRQCWGTVALNRDFGLNGFDTATGFWCYHFTRCDPDSGNGITGAIIKGLPEISVILNYGQGGDHHEEIPGRVPYTDELPPLRRFDSDTFEIRY